MATATTTTAAEPRGSEPAGGNPRTQLGVASLVGGAFVIAGVAVAAYLVPLGWQSVVSPVTAKLGGFIDGFLRLVAQLVAAGLVIWAGTGLAGRNPPRGLRGGILLVVSAVIAIFFIARAVGLNLEGQGAVGGLVTAVVLGGLLGLFVRYLFSAGGQRTMVAIEEQGWLHTFSYKPMQGLRVRRYTLIGLLLLGWTGVYSMITHQSVGAGDWPLAIPFTGRTITPLFDVQYSVPVLLAAATFWVAWRAVNMPTFADFLIATEAEMNKVSWSSRKRLYQDTIVVLVTTLLLTVFLLLTDLFWGALLSAVKVLPKRSQTAGQVDPVAGRQAKW